MLRSMTTPTTAARPPGRIWYAAAVLLAVAGWIAAAVVVVSGIARSAERMSRVLVPGQAEMVLDKAGTYTIFHEHHSTIENRVYTVETVSGLAVSVRAKAGGPPLPLTTAINSRYRYAGHSGRSLFNVEIPAPGTYIVAAAYSDGRKEPQTVLAVDRGFLGSLLSTIFGAIGLVFGGMAAGIALFVVFFIKRRKALRAAAA
jgi:hypothetical protein